MDYSSERRRRRRRYRSPPSYDQISSREEDDIEQEIINRYERKIILLKIIKYFRAMEIERRREKSLRRQFEYIVYNVKVSCCVFYQNKFFCFQELERRRHRTQSPEYYERTISPSRYRNSSPERFYQTNDNRSSSRLKKFQSYQITMVYHGNGNERHGDEIMVLQENIIAFKGFLRPDGLFEN
jgi:hypothetical protein